LLVMMLVEEQVLAGIKEYFLSNHEAAAVYLFGSTVKGVARANSDIDLAVLFYPELDKIQRFSAKLGITNDLEERARALGHEKKFDVVDIKSGDLFFIHQIMRNKILVLDKDPRYRVEFEVVSRRKYFDMQGFYKLYHEQVLQRLKGRP